MRAMSNFWLGIDVVVFMYTSIMAGIDFSLCL
jgi:hypothetical protein